nr:MAG TPA_asm: hypothetical protein [Bacteriophage sp.]
MCFTYVIVYFIRFVMIPRTLLFSNVLGQTALRLKYLYTAINILLIVTLYINRTSSY